MLGEGAEGAATAGVEVITVGSPESSGAARRLETEAARAHPIFTYVARLPDETATILYTSGTTGKPKGAVGAHFALVQQVKVLLANTFDMHQGDVVFGGLPLFHTFGQTCVLNPGLAAGATIVLCPRFTGEACLDLIQRHRVNIFFGVPTMYVAVLESARERPVALDSLRYCVSGGASLPVSVLDKFRQTFGVQIYEGYGLTETSPVASFNHVGTTRRPGTIGTPIWGVDIEIARAERDDSIELMPRGELGELVVRGHNLFKGYLNNPDATAEAIVDGWFRTGDLGTKDADGYLRILDRKKEMIIRNGYNVYPREFEEVLCAHPDVTTAAVFGVPDRTQGQEIAEAIILAPVSEVTVEEIITYARTRVAAYKYPRII